jgi:hypothetical protein
MRVFLGGIPILFLQQTKGSNLLKKRRESIRILDESATFLLTFSIQKLRLSSLLVKI